MFPWGLMFFSSRDAVIQGFSAEMLGVKNKDLQRAKRGTSKLLMICLRKAVTGTLAVNDDRRSANCDGGEMWCDTAEEQCLTSKRRPGLWELFFSLFSPSLFFSFLWRPARSTAIEAFYPSLRLPLRMEVVALGLGRVFFSCCLFQGWMLSVQLGMGMPPIKADVIRAVHRSNAVRAFHFALLWYPNFVQLLLEHIFSCLFVFLSFLSHSVASVLLF